MKQACYDVEYHDVRSACHLDYVQEIRESILNQDHLIYQREVASFLPPQGNSRKHTVWIISH